MKLVKQPYTDKPFVEVYEYIPVAIMPIIVFQASFMVLSQLLLIEWIGCLFIFFVLYFTSDESRIFRYVKEFRIKSKLLYLVSGSIAFLIGYLELLPLMIFLILIDIYWSFSVYETYKKLHAKANNKKYLK